MSPTNSLGTSSDISLTDICHLLLFVSIVMGAHGQEALPLLAWMTVDEGAILFVRYVKDK